jgi:mono/diheme cytochrome c family protein
MRLLAKVLGGLVLAVVLVLASLYVFSTNRLTKHYEVSDSSPPIPRDSASLTRGRHLARAISKCVECHGDDLAGQVLADEMPFARLVAPNLTTGRGGLGGLAEDAMVRAVRHGVAPSGRPLVLMPARNYWPMGDDDVGALIAYVRSVPPVDKELPPTAFGLVGRTLILGGKLDAMFEARSLDHSARRPPPPPADTTVAYGKYLADIGGCTGCHNPSLSGGAVPGAPADAKPAANITPEGIGSWTEADFFKALRDGVRPDGTPIDSTMMPIRLTREMTDLETRAIWMFLRTVPAKALGAQ